MAGFLLHPVPQELAQVFLTEDFSYPEPIQAEAFEFVKESLIRLQSFSGAQLFFGDESIFRNWNYSLQVVGMYYRNRATILGVSVADLVKFTTDGNGIVDALTSAANGHDLAQPCSLCNCHSHQT
jgi:hypothetical protein